MAGVEPGRGNERPDLCGPCGGQCCLGRPGLEAPERFLRSADPVGALASALAAGDWVLARHVGVPWADGVPPPDEDRYRVILYPRPATLAERAGGAVFRAGELSPCVFLGAGACRLSFDERPRMCRSLEPASDGECEAEWDQLAAALAWAPHQGFVLEARSRARVG